MNTDQPSDAPHGPVARYFARGVRRFMIGNGENSGGALGWEVLSPRLTGWLEQIGIPTVTLSRFVDGATNWATADGTRLRTEASARDKQVTQRKREAMRPLLTALWLVRGDTHGKRWLIREAHKLLSGEAGDEDAEGYARALVADGVLGDQLPSWRTMEGWFERVDIQDMIDCGVDDDWVP